MLQVEDIHTFYGRSHILQGVSLEIREGETVCLLGRNGAGKTTLLRSILGITPPRQGSIQFKREEISRKRTYLIARMGIGYIPEDRRVFPNITVKDNLEIARRRPSHQGIEWTLQRVYEFFPLLKELEGHRGKELSGGEQQVLTIARALMGNPELLLVDEISEGLGPLIVQNLIELIKTLKDHITILLVEQNARFAFSVSDRGYVIDKGRIHYHGLIKELMDDEEVKDRYLCV
jgi:branched-chain amino acid transport system ATP-binding protein